MRIVDRKTFLELPAGTLFALTLDEETIIPYSGVMIKMGQSEGGANVLNTFPDFEGGDTPDKFFQLMTMMVSGCARPKANYDIDGLGVDDSKWVDDKELYFVWDKADHKKLINCLTMAYDKLP